jgi:hypothetical protein
MPYAEGGSSGSYSGGSHWGGGGGGSTTKKKKHDWRDDMLKAFSGPAVWGLERSPWGFTQGIGHALGTLGTSPLQALLFPKSVPGQLSSALVGTVEGPYGFGKLMRPKSKGGGGMDFGQAAGMMLDSMKQDYKDRYGANWRDHARENSVFNLFDALSVVGAGARGATMLGAAGRLGDAGLERGLVNMWKESSRPGVLTGGEADRIVRYQPDTGPEQRSVQPWSRSPTRRGTQALSDVLAERFPTAPVIGARARITRAQGSTLRRIIDRTLGTVTGEESLNSKALGEAGRSRLFWEAQLGIAHADIPIEERNMRLTQLRNALAHEYRNDTPDGDPEFAQILREAKQAGFGEGVLLKRLDAAIDYTPGARYEQATQALRQATVLSEDVIADSTGFGSLQQDLKRVSDLIDNLEPQSEPWVKAVQERVRLRQQIAAKDGELRTMFRNRRSILRDWLDTKGDHEHSRRWEEALTPILGETEANQAIAFAHAMANKIRPDDPESWWADKVGMPGREGAAAFRQRVGDDALFQFGDEAGLLESGFYSPAQKWATENFTEPMPAGELRAKLRESIPDEEFYNAGLDMYFDALPEGAIVHPQEFKLLLANRVNAYNLRQVIRNNALTSDDPGLGTIYDRQRGDGVSISREPGDGEYYEVTFELPGKGRDATPFMDKNKHWGQENVAVHFRFHIFEEDGVRKLLVEEIQSDWANEARVQRQEGRTYREPTQHEQQAIDDLTREIEELTAHASELRGRQSVLDDAIRGGDTSSEARREWQEVTAEITALDQDWWELDQGFQFYNEEFGLGNIPPPPLSGSTRSAQSSYLNAPTRWIARAAVEADVDQVILVGREQQLLRASKAVDPATWLRLKDEGSEAITAWLKENPPAGSSFVSYDKDIPKLMGREFGQKGVKVDNAYTGEYRVPHNVDTSAKGQMPGTVFKVDKTFTENALKPKSMYQRTPDWDALPKGAVELFDGGRSRIHIFADGDVSTWIHELGHVALHDLSEADRHVIEAYYAAGKKVEKWTEMDHEAFARGFEQYVRDGKAPTRGLEPIFARISSWIRQVWEREKRTNPNLPDDVKRVFSTLFRSEGEPDIFIPHRAAEPDLGGGRTSRGIPRANREIGDRVIDNSRIFAKNKLGLMRSGMLYDDPRTLMEHANRVVALARANQLREAVLEMGEPLLPNESPNFDTQYVVKRAGRGVDKPYFDALESADDPAEIRQTITDYINDHITDKNRLYEEWKGESQLYVVDKKQVDMLFKYVTGKAPGAATKPATATAKVMDAVLDTFRGLLLYANPGFYMTNMIGNSAMLALKDPAAMRFLPWSMNQAVKAAANPSAPDEMWQRISMEMGRGPTSGNFSPQAVRDVLTARPGGSTNRVGQAAEVWSGALGEWGRRSGRVIDDSFRVAAWRQSATKMGYRTDKQVQDLLDDASVRRPFKRGEGRGNVLETQTKAEKDLAKIRDEAEQLMLDFDSLSPFERTYLQRAIFLYPFLKASTKYPFMFAGERPITAGALSEFGAQGEKFAEQEDVLGPRPDLPLWLQGYARGPGGYFNLGSFSPFNQPAQLLESAMNLRGPAPIGVQRPVDYLNPAAQLLWNLGRQQNAFGRETPTEEIIRTELPLPAYLAYPLRKPSTRWQERDFWNTLLRSLRVAPVGINEGE